MGTFESRGDGPMLGLRARPIRGGAGSNVIRGWCGRGLVCVRVRVCVTTFRGGMECRSVVKMNEASEYLEVSIYARVYIKSYGAQENFMPETEEAEVQCHVRISKSS